MWQYYLILTLSFIIFCFVVIALLPKALFSITYKEVVPSGTGIKKIETSEGVSVLFKMNENYNEYISQYLISSEADQNFLICKLNKKVYFLDYDIVVYNQRRKMIKVFNVVDQINKNGFTEKVKLPLYTEYIAIIINKANETKLKNKYRLKVKLPRVLLFSFVETILLFGLAIAMFFCFANIFGGVFTQTILENITNLLFLGIGFGIFFVINVLVLVLSLKVKALRKGGK